MIKRDVVIVGAGPAGVFSTLFLAKNGIHCTIVDKESFPRDKICGDGISGWVLTVLNELDQQLLIKLSKQPFILHSYGLRIVAPNFKQLDLPFFYDNNWDDSIPPGFTAKRVEFDNFMVNEMRMRKEVEFLEGIEVTGFEKNERGLLLHTSQGDNIEARIVIFANGAMSKFMKDPGGIIKTPKYTMSGIKTYFKGVTGFHPDNYVELHFLKEFLPGYLWIFPIAGGLANVGAGLDRRNISKRKINLKKAMFEAIENIPYLKERFKSAVRISKIEAWPLPLWDRKRSVSGDNFMLAGDAANLIDPVTGEGMGHAAISGMYAAKQVMRCLETGDFSAGFMKQYDIDLYNRIGKELNISKKIPQFIKYPRLFNGVVNKTLKNNELQQKLAMAMTDLEVRKELKKPTLYLKILLGI